jgi:hypothetical protein
MVLAGLTAALITTGAYALTINQEVTSEFLRDHPEEFRVKVSPGKHGLVDFRVTRTLSNPMYLVAHLAVHHQGKVIAESHSPAFTRNRENTFYFSLAPDDIADSTFELGESSFAESGGEAIPIVGTTNYQLHLKDFVPPDLLKAK